MKPMNVPPSDDELDRLLSRQLKDTTPGFEARWVALKRTLRASPPRRRFALSPARWSWLLAVGTAAVALLVVLRTPESAPGSVSPQLAELWAMDEVLAPGVVLLDTENRADLIYVANRESPTALSP